MLSTPEGTLAESGGKSLKGGLAQPAKLGILSIKCPLPMAASESGHLVNEIMAQTDASLPHPGVVRRAGSNLVSLPQNYLGVSLGITYLPHELFVEIA